MKYVKRGYNKKFQIKDLDGYLKKNKITIKEFSEKTGILENYLYKIIYHEFLSMEKAGMIIKAYPEFKDIIEEFE